MARASRVVQELRRARVLVVHPHDEDGDALVAHLKRLGCEIRGTWPLPAILPPDIDTVFLQIEGLDVDLALQVFENHKPTIIGIVTYESPTALQTIIDLNVHSVISKPLRQLGVLTQFVLGRYRFGYETRLANKAQKLEETLKGRRVVERAINALREMNGLSDDEAYKLLRDQATMKRLPMAVMAETIITTLDTMKSLDLALKNKTSSE